MADDSQRCMCGGTHRPVAAYGAWCCPERIARTSHRIVEEAETSRTRGGFRVVRNDGVSVGFFRTRRAAERKIGSLDGCILHHRVGCAPCAAERAYYKNGKAMNAIRNGVAQRIAPQKASVRAAIVGTLAGRFPNADIDTLVREAQSAAIAADQEMAAATRAFNETSIARARAYRAY